MGYESQATLPYDFAVYGAHGGLSAVLEVKRRFGATLPWAQAWHEAFTENTAQPPGASVVLITPERIYVWRPGAAPAAAPDWELDAEPRLAPYFARLKISTAEVHPRVFEQIVGLWLQDATQQAPSGGTEGPGSALHGLLRGGHVVEQDAA